MLEGKEIYLAEAGYPLKESPLTKQVGGNHYQGFAIAPIDFVHKNNLGFIEGNIIKYVCRFRKKERQTRP